MSTTNYYRKNQMGLLPSETIIKEIYSTSPRIVSRPAATLPQTAQTPYFRVNGRVIITRIVGEVVTATDATGCNLDLWSNPTVGADVALCTTVAIASDAIGTLYTITGTFANAMIATTSGAVPAQTSAVLITDGTIDLKTSGNNPGATKWILHYIPLDENSTVVAI